MLYKLVVQPGFVATTIEDSLHICYGEFQYSPNFLLVDDQDDCVIAYRIATGDALLKT